MLSSWIAGMDSAEVCETIYASRPICVKVSAQPACRASACMSVRWLHGQVLGCLQVNMCAAHTHEEGEYCRVLTVLCLRLCSQVVAVLPSCHAPDGSRNGTVVLLASSRFTFWLMTGGEVWLSSRANTCQHVKTYMQALEGHDGLHVLL